MAHLDPEIENAFERANGFPFNPVLIGRMGSHSHGTWIAPEEAMGSDDTDYMAFVLPPPEAIIGLRHWEGWNWQHDHLDVTVYSIAKAFRLLLKGNPNVIGMLWLEKEDQVFTSSDGQDMLEHRERFSSRESLKSFLGYARAQFAHMEKSPTVKGYMGEKRKAIFHTFGYDTKNAAHLIRLLWTAIEFARTGVLKVRRPENECAQLRDIKQGKWLRGSVTSLAGNLHDQLRAAIETSVLPERPETGKAETMLMWIHLDYLRIGEAPCRTGF
jgi:predicted nucleotidyltransferase